MEFVEQDRRDALKLRVIENHAGKHAFGHDLDASLGRDAIVETHAVADGFADFFI